MSKYGGSTPPFIFQMNHKKIVLIIVLLCVSVISVFSSFTAVISDTVSSNDTLQSVTDRGATTNNQIIINNDLGIGTTPNRAFHVLRTSNSADDDQIVSIFENDGTSNQVRIALKISSDTSTNSRLFGSQYFAIPTASGIVDYEARAIRFLTGESVGTASNRLIINPNGSIEIGSILLYPISPDILQFEGNIRASGSSPYLSNYIDDTKGSVLRTGSGGNTFFGYIGGQFSIRNTLGGAAGDDIFRIEPNAPVESLIITADGTSRVKPKSKSKYAFEVFDTNSESRGGIFLGSLGHSLLRLYDGINENVRLQGTTSGVSWLRTLQGLIIDTHTPFGSNPEAALHIVDNIGGIRGGVYVERYANSVITATGIVMGKARGTPTSPSAVQNGDRLAFFLASGRTIGSSWANGAGITFKVDGTVTTTNVPTSISFETGTSGSNREDKLIMSSGSEIYMPFVYNVEVGATHRDLYIDNTGKLGYVSSSERYKEDIIEYDSTRRITDLQVKEYTRTGDTKTEVGLIAEEVAVLFPELVSYKLEERKIWTICNNEDTNYTNVPCQKTQFVQTNIPETVQYSKIGLFLIDDVQKLQSQVTALEQRIITLENTKR